jgi:hypothetical protein
VVAVASVRASAAEYSIRISPAHTGQHAAGGVMGRHVA